MRPHEETDWTASDLYDWFDRTACLSPVARDQVAARARLAAYAPDMARILLEGRWHHAECVACGGHQHQGGCSRECPIATVLRNAGVLD